VTAAAASLVASARTAGRAQSGRRARSDLCPFPSAGRADRSLFELHRGPPQPEPRRRCGGNRRRSGLIVTTSSPRRPDWHTLLVTSDHDGAAQVPQQESFRTTRKDFTGNLDAGRPPPASAYLPACRMRNFRSSSDYARRTAQPAPTPPFSYPHRSPGELNNCRDESRAVQLQGDRRCDRLRRARSRAPSARRRFCRISERQAWRGAGVPPRCRSAHVPDVPTHLAGLREPVSPRGRGWIGRSGRQSAPRATSPSGSKRPSKGAKARALSRLRQRSASPRAHHARGIHAGWYAGRGKQ